MWEAEGREEEGVVTATTEYGKQGKEKETVVVYEDGSVERRLGEESGQGGTVHRFSPKEEGARRLVSVSFNSPHKRGGEVIRNVEGKWKVTWDKKNQAVTKRVAIRHLLRCKEGGCKTCEIVLNQINIGKERKKEFAS